MDAKNSDRSIAVPVAPEERIASIDVLRGVVVLGILVINIWFFGRPFSAVTSPEILGTFAGPDIWAFVISWIGFEGSQRAVFSMLFGASVILLTSRLSDGRTASPARIYYRRTGWLILFGLVDAYLLLWPGDILFIYGVCGLVLYPLRNAQPRTLFLMGCGILVLLAAINIVGAYYLESVTPIAIQAQEILARGGTLTDAQVMALDFVQSMPGYIPSPEELSAEIERRRAGYLSAFLPNAQEAFEFQVVLGLLSLYWDALALMLIGMAFFRWGVLSGSLGNREYGLLAFVGLGVGLAVNSWEAWQAVQDGYTGSFTSWTYDLGRLSMGVGYVGLIMLICNCGWWPKIRDLFAAVGRMALTNYVMQTLICNVIFIGFGLFGQLRFHELYYVVAAVWIFELIASRLWLERFRYGPLEWLWRWLTYRKNPTRQ